MLRIISQFITLTWKLWWSSQPRWQSRLANSSVTIHGCRSSNPLGLSEMLLQVECWPPLTLVLKAWRVKCCLRCHIWPGGEVIQNCPPNPNRISIQNPRRQPAYLLLSVLSDTQTADATCQTQDCRRDAVWFYSPFSSFCIWQTRRRLNLSPLLATIFVLSSAVRHLLCACVCECVCAFFFVPFPCSLGTEGYRGSSAALFVSHGSGKGLLT